jgi:hypothetical protein
MSYSVKIRRLAKHLKINPAQIKSAEEWANCWLVVVRGLGARFVSKTVTSIKVVVAKVFSVIEGRKVEPSEVQKVDVYADQVHVRLSGILTYCGIDYFKEIQRLID